MVTSGWAMSILPGLEHLRIFEARGEAEIAAADRHAEALEARMALEIVERQRRFDPGEVVCRLKIGISGRPSSAFAQAVAASTISRMSGPTCSRAVRMSERRLIEVVAPERIGDDLDRLQPELQAAVDVAAHLVRRLAQRIDRAIGEHAVALARWPSSVATGLPSSLAAQVPERDVDRADGMDDGAAPAVIAGRVVHLAPTGLRRPQGSCADQHLLQSHGMGVRARRLDDGADHRGHAVDLGDAGHAFVGVDEDDAIVVGAVEGQPLSSREPAAR